MKRDERINFSIIIVYPKYGIMYVWRFLIYVLFDSRILNIRLNLLRLMRQIKKKKERNTEKRM